MTQIWQRSSGLSYKVCFAEIEKEEAKLWPIFDNVDKKKKGQDVELPLINQGEGRGK